MKKRTYFIFLPTGLIVMFFALYFIGREPAEENSKQRLEQDIPVVQIVLGDVDVLSPNWASVAKLLDVCAEMGYWKIELNEARISLPTLPVDMTEEEGYIIIHQEDIPQTKLILDGTVSLPLPPEKRYDFSAVHKWCKQYGNEPVNVIFGDRVKVDVVVWLIQVLNKHDVNFHLKNIGMPFGKENPTSIKLELNNSLSVRIKV
jgi:hypothetical protein